MKHLNRQLLALCVLLFCSCTDTTFSASPKIEDNQEQETGGTNDTKEEEEEEEFPIIHTGYDVLATFFTGRSVGYSPMMRAALDDLLREQEFADRVIVAEAHTFSPASNLYPSSPIDQVFGGVSMYPSLFVNFMDDSIGNYGYEENKQQIRRCFQEALQEPARVSIQADQVEWAGNYLSVRVKVTALKSGFYGIGAWLCESNLYEKQQNYPDCGVSSEEYDLDMHHNVIRLADHPELKGSPLSNGVRMSANERDTHFFNFKFNSAWKRENSHLLIFVTASDAQHGIYTVTKAIRCEI